jgi:hypothetical protein
MRFSWETFGDLIGVLDAADGVGVTLVKPLLAHEFGSIRQILSMGSVMREISTG